MPDCRDLGETRQHDALQRMTRRARRGRLKMTSTEVADDLARYVLNSHQSQERGRDLVQDLFWEGFIHGDGEGGFDILVPCRCSPQEKFLTSLPTNRPRAGASGIIAAYAAEMEREPGLGSEGGVAAGTHKTARENYPINNKQGHCVPVGAYYAPTPREPDSPLVKLAREVFPRVCQECGIRLLPPEMKWLALSGRIKVWIEEEGLSYEFIEDMMWEFGRHPEWARKSRRPAWLVFLGRKQELASLVASHRQRVGVSGERDTRAVWLEHDPVEAHRNDVGWWLDETRRPVFR